MAWIAIYARLRIAKAFWRASFRCGATDANRLVQRRDPLADFLPLFLGHGGLVAKRHCLVLHRLGKDQRRIFLQLIDGFERDVLRRFLEALMRGLPRMTHGAVLRAEREHLRVGHFRAIITSTGSVR